MSKLGLFAMFARLAEPPAPGTGAWRIRTDDGREGVVLMEAGRLCWANHDLSARLSEQLERRFGITRAAIDQIGRARRETGQPLGVALVEQGLLTPPQLASALREHTCRSILSLVKSGVRACDWEPLDATGHTADATITPTQAACRCVALVKGLDGERYEASLEAMLAGEAAGLLIHAGARLPFAASAAPMAWQQLRDWLTWLLRIDGLCPVASRGFVAGRGERGGWVVWRAEAMVGLAVTASEDAQRRLLVRVASTVAGWAVDQPPDSVVAR